MDARTRMVLRRCRDELIEVRRWCSEEISQAWDDSLKEAIRAADELLDG